MITVGITGGSGSGKSTAARFLVQKGAKCIDADLVYHSLIEKPSDCTRALSREFGASVLTADGALDRRALSEIVFAPTDAGRSALARLNEITHHYVQKECEKQLEAFREANVPVTVLDVPLLFESGMDKLCNVTLAFIASKKIRLARIIKRDGITKEAAEARIAAQPSDEYYKECADHVIENNGDKEELQRSLSHLLPKIMR